jgi:endonuclease/exonuclease/phosphatase (EEP) superfamily protein YafD
MDWIVPLLYGFTGITLLAVLLPFVHNSYWVFRVFEYPRFQKLVLCIILFLAWLPLKPWRHTPSLVCTIALFLSIAYLLYKIFPYTGWNSPEMKAAVTGAPGDRIKVFSGNVWQDNTNHAGWLRLIRQMDPDIILLLETDAHWEQGVAALEADYPYIEKKALDNTYGMLFYSRLPLRQSFIQFLTEDDIPSLDAIIELPGGQPVQLWGLHPKPPMPQEDTRSDAKDKELMQIALKARETELPIIVLGDLNDVAWSRTTELFRKTSQLLDPRRGRGFYSTFSAKHWWVRFPLDYIFASTHFTLVGMKRLPPTGSDHFPIFIELAFSNASVAKQEAPQADESELEEAVETANKPLDH